MKGNSQNIRLNLGTEANEGTRLMNVPVLDMDKARAALKVMRDYFSVCTEVFVHQPTPGGDFVVVSNDAHLSEDTFIGYFERCDFEDFYCSPDYFAHQYLNTFEAAYLVSDVYNNQLLDCLEELGVDTAEASLLRSEDPARTVVEHLNGLLKKRVARP